MYPLYPRPSLQLVDAAEETSARTRPRMGRFSPSSLSEASERTFQLILFSGGSSSCSGRCRGELLLAGGLHDLATPFWPLATGAT